MSESASYRCPRCGQYNDVEKVSEEVSRELECPNCGQKVTMQSMISVSYMFLCHHDSVDYNVSAEADDTGELHIMEEEDEWKEVHSLLNPRGRSE